jgi:HEAT repeat protein
MRAGAQDVNSLIELLGDSDALVSFKAAKALEEAGPIAVDALIKALESKDVTVREEVIRAMSGIRDERVVEPLIRALDDQSAEVRICAAQALVRTRDSRALKPLIKALADVDVNVRRGVAQALGERGDPQAIRNLMVVAEKDADGGVWSAANMALEKLRSSGSRRNK